jgi:hypothetical protein
VRSCASAKVSLALLAIIAGLIGYSSWRQRTAAKRDRARRRPGGEPVPVPVGER